MLILSSILSWTYGSELHGHLAKAETHPSSCTMCNTFTDGKQILPPADWELSYVDRCIERELTRRARATSPAARFLEPIPDQARSYAKSLHRAYTTTEVDDHRREISNLEYWKCEAERFRDEFIRITMDQLPNEQLNDGMHPADAWRNTAFALHRKLKRQGLSNEQIYQARLGIEQDTYWDRKVDLFERASLEHRYKFYRRLGNLPTWSPVDSEGLTLAAPYVRKHSPYRSVQPVRELRRLRRVQIANERKGSTTSRTRKKLETRRGKYKPRHQSNIRI